MAKEGEKVLNTARASGKMIRECSCEEQETCIVDMKASMVECFDTCFDKADLSKLTEKREDLKQCFEKKEYIVENFLNCLEHGSETCIKDKNGPQVPYTDINGLINGASAKVKAKAEKFLNSLNNQGQDLLDSALHTGQCMKDCFLQKNAGGYCFDKTGCQPKIDAEEIKETAKKCSKEIGWKKEASEMCSCAQKAGVEKVKPYCTLLQNQKESRRMRRHA